MFTLCLVVLAGGAAPHAAPPFDAEERALAYLLREVPSSAREHRCYSCHNNGDAVRALAMGIRLGRSVKAEALADSARWLAKPAGWDHNGGEGPFSDKKLATLHFAAALVDLAEAGVVKDRRSVEQAARRVVALQEKDGSWQVVRDGTLGSAITHGNVLATHLAARTLRRAENRRFAESIRRAENWLSKAPIETVLDAGAMLLARGKAVDQKCLDLFRKGEARCGGWGPYVNSAPEVFDTAVVLLGLSGLATTADVIAWKKRGRAYLLATQQEDGSWPETTRPSGGDSYSQRISTSAWATMALLATSSRRTAP